MSHLETLRETHVKKGTDEYITPKPAHVAITYANNMVKNHGVNWQTDHGDDDMEYIRSSGGMKKGRVYGLGSLMDNNIIFSAGSSARSSSSFTYSAPQANEEISLLKSHLKKMEATMDKEREERQAEREADRKKNEEMQLQMSSIFSFFQSQPQHSNIQQPCMPRGPVVPTRSWSAPQVATGGYFTGGSQRPAGVYVATGGFTNLLQSDGPPIWSQQQQWQIGQQVGGMMYTAQPHIVQNSPPQFFQSSPPQFVQSSPGERSGGSVTNLTNNVIPPVTNDIVEEVVDLNV